MASQQAQLPMASHVVQDGCSTDDTGKTQNAFKLEGVVNMLISLKEADSFQELNQLVDQVRLLRTESESKDKRLVQLEEEKRERQERHDQIYKDLEESHYRSHSKATSDRERLVKTIVSLKTNAKANADERTQIESRVKKHEAETKRLKDELHSSQADCKRHILKVDEVEKRFQQAKGEAERLHGELQHERSEMTELNKAKTSLEKRHDAVLQKHNSTKAELADLQNLAVKLNTEDLATTTQRLESIWQSASSIVRRYLQANLSPTCLTDVELWKSLKNPPGMAHTIPLPRSDTPAARDMRGAVILAYLFHKINQEIFQPCYLFHEDADGRRTLLLQAMHNSREECFYRSVLLSVSPGEQTQIVQDRADGVVAEVMWMIQGMLPQDQMEDFRADLHGLLGSVCTAWQRIQRLSTRFEPNMEYTEDEDFEWQALQLESAATANGGGAPAAARDVADRVELVIFPRLYIAKDGQPRPVTSGVVLRHSQTAAAAQELRNEEPPSPTFGRGYSTRSRPRADSLSVNETLSKQRRSAFLSRGAPDGRTDGGEQR